MDQFPLLLKRLELPNIQWIWFVDDYTRTLPEYELQVRFKYDAKQTLLQLKKLIKEEQHDSYEILRSVGPFYVLSPWCDQESVLLAREIILSLKATEDRWNQLKAIITDDLRLLKNSRVSNAGYKKIILYHGIKPSLGFQQDQRDDWKQNHIKSLPLFAQWLSHLDSKGIRDNWWLISPTILNILDDHESPIKLRGVELLSILLDIVEPSFLLQTGLFSMFYDAIKPLLSCLPSLTPTDLSTQILEETYPTLIKLFQCTSDEKKHLLDLVNVGIFSSLNQVRDNFKVLRVLMQKLAIIIGMLQNSTMMILPRLIYSIGMIISNPFIDADQELLSCILDCIIQLELNCWMRLSNHRYDILGFALMAWPKANDDLKMKVAAVKILLEKCVTITDDEWDQLGKQCSWAQELKISNC
jgi:hypothetical protein